jgi:mannose/fructose/N-acetylgalactosamine-specific phosphotransferase system component IIC
MMDLGIIIAIVGSAFGIIAVTISMFFWLRAEANADRRSYQDIAREDRKDMLTLIRSIEMEIKDFHHRLLKIEEKK